MSFSDWNKLSDLFADARSPLFATTSTNRVHNNSVVALYNATTPGGGTISKNEDGTRCVLAGREILRIIKLTSTVSVGQPDDLLARPQTQPPTSRSSTGTGGARADASPNYWKQSGLKIDSAFTDVCWGAGPRSETIITSARNGELHLWDLGKGGARIERKSRPHTRSVNDLAYTSLMPQAVFSGSQDGTAWMWDLRARQPTLKFSIASSVPVRCLVLALPPYSPNPTALVQASSGASSSASGPTSLICGIDNGSLIRFDLRSHQKVLDRVLLAHQGPVTSCDWIYPNSRHGSSASGISTPASGSGGYLATAGLDKTIKIWEMSPSLSPRPLYTLHPSFSVRRVLFRPGYECEVAIVSSAEGEGDKVEIWDVRRGWVPKWRVDGAGDGVTDITFPDPSTLWTHSSNGSFAQTPLSSTVTFMTPFVDQTKYQMEPKKDSRLLTRTVSALGVHRGLSPQPDTTPRALTAALPHMSDESDGRSHARSLTSHDHHRARAASSLSLLSGQRVAVTQVTEEDGNKAHSHDGEAGSSRPFVTEDDSDTGQGPRATTQQENLRLLPESEITCSRPIDALPRSVVAWEVSGHLAFAVDGTQGQVKSEERTGADLGHLASDSSARPGLFPEIPYDDIPSSLRNVVKDRKAHLKALGDPPYVPESQRFGIYHLPMVSRERYSLLAHALKMEMGSDGGKKELCLYNAEVSSKLGHFQSAQIWYLMHSLLTDYKPSSPTATAKVESDLQSSISTSMHLSMRHPLTTQYQHHSALTSANRSPEMYRATSLTPIPDAPASLSFRPGGAGTGIGFPRKSILSPPSSLSSSPRFRPGELSPICDNEDKQPLATPISRSQSVAQPTASSTRLRSSLSPVSMRETPANINKSKQRIVGFDALDDSDSGSDREHENDNQSDIASLSTSQILNDGHNLLRSPPPLPFISHKHSPLHQVSTLYGEDEPPGIEESPRDDEHPQHFAWRSDEESDSEDEDDEDDGYDAKVSPRSVTAHSGSSSGSGRSIRFVRDADISDDEDYVRQTPSPNRSPIITSMRAKGSLLFTQHSTGSAQTVTAADVEKRRSLVSLKESPPQSPHVASYTDIRQEHEYEPGPMSFVSGEIAYSKMFASHSQAQNTENHNDKVSPSKSSERVVKEWRQQTFARRKFEIERNESRYRQIGWAAVKQQFQHFVEQGDIQMAAHMAVVAGEQLEVNTWQERSLLEAYIDQLSRLQLPVACAYIRKHTKIRSISLPSQVETTHYTSCGRCGKALDSSITVGRPGAQLTGGYGYCQKCQRFSSICPICQLPVRGLRMHCGICSHGGHLNCYRKYYSRRSAVEINPFIPSSADGSPWGGRGQRQSLLQEDSKRRVSSDSTWTRGSGRIRKVMGHPCAAGCGHICFASNIDN